MEIRALSEADAEAFWQLQLRSRQEDPESFATSYEELAHTPKVDIVKQLQSSDDSFIIGAFAPALVGMVAFYRQHGLKLRHKGKIFGMYVAPEFRRQGIGRVMVLALISRAALITDLEELLLCVSTTNIAARSLYLSLGFKSYGIEPKALKHLHRYTDDDLMALTLR